MAVDTSVPKSTSRVSEIKVPAALVVLAAGGVVLPLLICAQVQYIFRDIPHGSGQNIPSPPSHPHLRVLQKARSQ